VIGPQRSGKTVNVISGILDWHGPAILSSVRDDIFAHTHRNRASLGTVHVFDPFETLGALPPDVVRVSWSPLQIASTVSGAMEAAAVLLEAAPIEGTTNATYWSKKGEALLWPILFAAAIGHKTMEDVVRWLALQDGMHPAPTDQGTPTGSLELGGEVRGILRDAAVGDDSLAAEAAHALRHFDGFEKLDPRTRSDIYSTSQTLVQPWEDPRVARSSSTKDWGPAINLDSVIAGCHTLYVVQPLKSADRFAVVFGGLLGALVKDQGYERAHATGKPLPDLLVVIDEAGNTPLQWLPAVASTCSGIGVLLVTVWQSKAQIDALYQKQADPLLTNHGSKIFFAGASDQATLDYVSWLCGEEQVTTHSINQADPSSSGRRSVGEATTQRRLVPTSVLRSAIPGDGLLVHGTLPPAHIRSRRYWKATSFAYPRPAGSAAGFGDRFS
jgi:type IV secretion system protein VirD4